MGLYSGKGGRRIYGDRVGGGYIPDVHWVKYLGDVYSGGAAYIQGYINSVFIIRYKRVIFSRFLQ